MEKITTAQLSATDQDSKPTELIYRITTQPQLGHLEHVASPGIQISSFTQADLASRNVQYVRSSGTGKQSDAFSFVLSDGLHEVRGPMVHPRVLRFLGFFFEGSGQAHWRYETIMISCS